MRYLPLPVVVIPVADVGYPFVWFTCRKFACPSYFTIYVTFASCPAVVLQCNYLQFTFTLRLVTFYTLFFLPFTFCLQFTVYLYLPLVYFTHLCYLTFVPHTLPRCLCSICLCLLRYTRWLILWLRVQFVLRSVAPTFTPVAFYCYNIYGLFAVGLLFALLHLVYLYLLPVVVHLYYSLRCSPFVTPFYGYTVTFILHVLCSYPFVVPVVTCSYVTFYIYVALHTRYVAAFTFAFYSLPQLYTVVAALQLRYTFLCLCILYVCSVPCQFSLRFALRCLLYGLQLCGSQLRSLHVILVTVDVGCSYPTFYRGCLYTVGYVYLVALLFVVVLPVYVVYSFTYSLPLRLVVIYLVVVVEFTFYPYVLQLHYLHLFILRLRCLPTDYSYLFYFICYYSYCYLLVTYVVVHLVTYTFYPFICFTFCCCSSTLPTVLQLYLLRLRLFTRLRLLQF